METDVRDEEMGNAHPAQPDVRENAAKLPECRLKGKPSGLTGISFSQA